MKTVNIHQNPKVDVSGLGTSLAKLTALLRFYFSFGRGQGYNPGKGLKT
jgi:hypothetical protein